LQASTDDLVGQGRLVPGQLDQLLGLMGVGQVLVANDANPQLTSALDPARVKSSLAGQASFAQPLASYGPRALIPPQPGRGGPDVPVTELQRYRVGASQGIVRLQPRSAPAILDGDASGVIELAAHHALGDQALMYA